MRHLRRTFLISSGLATAALLGFAPLTPCAAQQAETTAGVTAAVNPATRGTPPVTAPRDLTVGTNVFRQERVETQAEGQAQMLFLDGSSVTVGPDSNLVLDDFVYTPDQGGGKLALSMSKGVARFVGGRLSKTGEVTITTSVAEIGIRGGVAIIEVDGVTGATRATLLYGISLTIKNQEGVTQRITRPGFTVGVANRGARPTPPTRASSATISASLGKLEGRSGASGGSSNPPTDSSVAASAVASENAATPLPVGDVVAHAQAEAAAHSAAVAQDVQATTVRAVQQASTPTQPVSGVTLLAYNINSNGNDGLDFPIDLTKNNGLPAPGAAFTPLVIVKSAADGFSPSQTTAPRTLQAGMAISGQGASQVSAIEVNVGAITNQSGAAPYNLRAGFTASYRATATGPVTLIGMGFGEILPGNQPEFSGTTAPTTFQFDDHQYVGDAIGSTLRQNDDPTSPFFKQATVSTPGQPSTSTPFAATATRTTLNSSIGVTRTSQTLAGYANGIGTVTLPSLANAGSYIIDNASNNPLDVTITTNAATSQVGATFNLSAPTTISGNPSINSSSNVSVRANVPVVSEVLQFGTPTNVPVPAGFSIFHSNGTFVDNSGFAARSAEAALQPGFTTQSGYIDTVNGKTVDNSANAANSIKYLVSSSPVKDGLQSIVPAGVSLCSCEYAQWGFWGGQVSTALDQPGNDRRDRFNLATWVAGPLPDPATIPQVGTATYSGHAIGSVFSNGAQYVAVGGFQNSYNFATKTGTVSLTSFDNANYQATVSSANGRDYAGALTNAANANVKGSLQGSFFAGAGDPVRETGGKFTVTDLRGLTTAGANLYAAAGIFVGKKP